VAIQYRGTGTSGNSGGTAVTSVTATLPAGWQPGDLLFFTVRIGSSAVTGFSQTGGTGTWATDFSAANSTGGYYYAVAHRLMAAGDTAPAFGWTTSSTTCTSCGGFFSDAGGVLSLEGYAAGDPAQNAVAGTSITPGAITAAGPGRASVIITDARASAAASPVSHAYTPPAGWTWNDGDGSFFAGGANARFSAHCYQLGVTGTVTPGSQSLTDSTSDNFFFSVFHALVAETPPPGVGQARPGRTWLRRFHHRQQQLQAVTLAQAAAPMSPVVFPAQPPRTGPHRARLGATGALAAGILATGIGPPAVRAPHQPPAVAHPAPHRALWRSGQGAAPAALRQPFRPITIYRRKPHGALWDSGAGVPPAARPQPSRPVTVWSRAPHRVLWRAVAGPPPAAVVSTGAPQPMRPVTVFRRTAHGAIWRAVRGTPPAAARQPFRPATVFSRAPHRAAWRQGQGAPPAARKQPFRPVTIWIRAAHRAAWRAIAGPPPPPPPLIAFGRATAGTGRAAAAMTGHDQIAAALAGAGRIAAASGSHDQAGQAAAGTDEAPAATGGQ